MIAFGLGVCVGAGLVAGAVAVLARSRITRYRGQWWV